MNTSNLILKLLLLICTVLITVNASYASDSGDVVEPETGLEKSRVKAGIDSNTNTKPLPTAGQLIFSSGPLPTNTKQPEISIQPSTVSDKKPMNTTEDKNNVKKDNKSNDSGNDGETNKKTEKKKPSTETSNSNSDDADFPPKRVFRPRFRAESSAQTLKSTIIPLLILPITLILIIFT